MNIYSDSSDMNEVKSPLAVVCHKLSDMKNVLSLKLATAIKSVKSFVWIVDQNASDFGKNKNLEYHLTTTGVQ